MTKFNEKSFSVLAAPTDEYRDNWERTFGKKEVEVPIAEAPTTEAPAHFPVHPFGRFESDPKFIHIEAAEAAFAQYAEWHKDTPDTLDTVRARGGFTAQELDALLPGWRSDAC